MQFMGAENIEHLIGIRPIFSNFRRKWFDRDRLNVEKVIQFSFPFISAYPVNHYIIITNKHSPYHEPPPADVKSFPLSVLGTSNSGMCFGAGHVNSPTTKILFKTIPLTITCLIVIENTITVFYRLNSGEY